MELIRSLNWPKSEPLNPSQIWQLSRDRSQLTFSPLVPKRSKICWHLAEKCNGCIMLCWVFNLMFIFFYKKLIQCKILIKTKLWSFGETTIFRLHADYNNKCYIAHCSSNVLYDLISQERLCLCSALREKWGLGRTGLFNSELLDKKLNSLAVRTYLSH